MLVAVGIAIGGMVAVSSPASAASACSPGQTLRYGQVNSCVRLLQIYLNGYVNADMPVDSSFGPKTRTAVMTFQSRMGIAVDGSVGPQTRDTICGPGIGIPVNSGATAAEIVAAGEAVFEMCRGWGYVYD